MSDPRSAAGEATVLCYFSGTGNTRRAADRLAGELPSARLYPIVAALESEAAPVIEADIVGLVFPIHALGLPPVFERFLKRARFSGSPRIFALSMRECSSRVAVRVDRLLRRRGHRLHAFFAIQSPQSYLPMFPTAMDRDAVAMEEELDVVIPRIAEAVGRDAADPLPRDPALLAVISHTLFPLVRLFYRATGHFRLSRRLYADERCSACGICVSVCPAERIAIEDGTVVWNDSRACLNCLACLHYCPRASIQIRGTKTREKGRFHNPHVRWPMIAEQRPDRADLPV